MFESAEYQQRLNRLQNSVQQAGLDAFVVRTDTNVIYLTGVDFHSMERPVLMVVGENDFQMMLSQMLVAMKREMPDPRP